jgi:hypothetical protein
MTHEWIYCAPYLKTLLKIANRHLVLVLLFMFCLLLLLECHAQENACVFCAQKMFHFLAQEEIIYLLSAAEAG